MARASCSSSAIPIIEFSPVEQRVGQQLIQQRFCWTKRRSLAFAPLKTTCASYLQTGSAGQVLFPDGKFIGEDGIRPGFAQRFNMSVPEFEEDVRHDIVSGVCKR